MILPAKLHANSKSIFYFWFNFLISVRFLIFHQTLGKKVVFRILWCKPTKMIKLDFLSKILGWWDVIFEIKYPKAELEDLHLYPLPPMIKIFSTMLLIFALLFFIFFYFSFHRKICCSVCFKHHSNNFSRIYDRCDFINLF